MNTVEIISPQEENHYLQAATLLVEEFKEHWPDAWPTLEDALLEMEQFKLSTSICLIAVQREAVVGWIGGLPQYSGNVWEMHPIVVKRSEQKKGIGRELVYALEKEVLQRGGITITLGTDDESSMTSLADTDLYENLWDRIKNIVNYKDHPFSFYQKLGYTITGVMPDANGIGKPDIFMSKRIRK